MENSDKVKTTTGAMTLTTTTATTSMATTSAKGSMKTQTRYQEHNYTNLLKAGESSNQDEGSTSKGATTATTLSTSSSVASSSDSKADGPKGKSSGSRGGGSSSASDQVLSRQSQPSSTQSSDSKPTFETRSRVYKKDAFNRIRRSEEELQKAAEMVRGGMTFQTASDTFKIPISTIRFYMARRGILPQRRRGRGSTGVRDDDLIHPPFEIIHYRLPDIDKPV